MIIFRKCPLSLWAARLRDTIHRYDINLNVNFVNPPLLTFRVLLTYETACVLKPKKEKKIKDYMSNLVLFNKIR